MLSVCGWGHASLATNRYAGITLRTKRAALEKLIISAAPEVSNGSNGDDGLAPAHARRVATQCRLSASPSSAAGVFALGTS